MRSGDARALQVSGSRFYFDMTIKQTNYRFTIDNMYTYVYYTDTIEYDDTISCINMKFVGLPGIWRDPMGERWSVDPCS